MLFPLLCRPWGTTIYFLKVGNFLFPLQVPWNYCLQADEVCRNHQLYFRDSWHYLTKSAAVPKWGMGQLQSPPHTALLFTAFPAQFEHSWSACYRKILYLMSCFTAAISMVPRTLLATRCFTAQPCPGQTPALSIWAAPTWTSVLPFRAPYWPWRHNLSVIFPKRVSDRCILTVYKIFLS